MRPFRTSLLMTFFVLSFCQPGAKGQSNDKTFIPKAEAHQVGVDPEPLDRLISDIRSDRITGINALLVIKEQKLITEAYFGDRDRASLQYVASVSKSFASALLGIAIDKGFLGDDIPTTLNKPVKELFPKYHDLISQDPLKEKLKLTHLLTMTAGFEWDEHTHPYSSAENDCVKINNAPDPMKFLLSRKLIEDPGTTFYYNGGLSLSISYLIEYYTGMPVDEFAEEYLFKPLGITEYRWEKVAGGLVDTDGGLHLSPIDQAKFGYLFLQNGVWNGNQIVSTEWVQISTKMHHEMPDSPDYGFQWWGGSFNALWKSFPSYLASGYGGQKIFILPDQDCVVVICQQVFNNPIGDINSIAILSSYVLPAIEKIEPVSSSTADYSSYVGRYTAEDPNDFLDISLDQGQLVANTTDGGSILLTRFSPKKFMGKYMDFLDVYFDFLQKEINSTKTLKVSFGFREGIYILSNK